MPTRGQKAAADQAASKEQVLHISHAESAKTAHSPAYPTKTTRNGATETIGDRLRKRRRTESSRPVGSPPSPKLAQLGQVGATIGFQEQIRPTYHAATKNAQGKVTEGIHDSAQGPQLDSPPGVHMPTAPQQLSAGDHPTEGPSAPDFNTVIADIINHGETVDNHYATRGFDDFSMLANGHFQHISASFTLKTQSLPVLENLATQILEIMARSSYHEILTIATKPDTDPGQAYATLKSLFDHTKKVYSVQEPFLNPYELGLVDSGQLNIIRKTNMATFVSSVFGSQDVGFYHLNENFLDTFVADGNRLLKSQAQLFLELKTQAYISAVQNSDRSREEILEDLFPQNLEEVLFRRRSGAKQLAPSEAEFIQRARNRRRALLEEATNLVAIQKLPEKYLWEAFLRDVSAYVTKNIEAIAGIPAPKSTRPVRPPDSACEEKQHNQHDRRQRRFSQKDVGQPGRQPEQAELDSSRLGSSQLMQASFAHTSPTMNPRNDIAEKAAQAAQYAMQDFSAASTSALPQQSPFPAQSPTDGDASETPQQATKQDTPQIQYHFEHPLHPNVPAPPLPYYQNMPYQNPEQLQQQWNGNGPTPSQLHPSFGVQQGIPYPTQSAPTQVLYERARTAATTKALPNSRRAGHPSQRRPWTTEEESSLMAGLDRVKGPHWSQILAMFGPGGTINEVLKDRNQVQLKDKARNLKLFFLKSGIEVPYYLQFVTGELKTRAPARAAKNEAREKGTTDEDRAHIEGLMALASRPPQDTDQAVANPGDQHQSMIPNNHVPMADMGIGSGSNALNGVEVPIDPQVTGGASGRVDGAVFNTDASVDGMRETTMPKFEQSQR